MNRTAVACFADVSEFLSLKTEFCVLLEDIRLCCESEEEQNALKLPSEHNNSI